jgi:thioredoxin-related protein
MKPLHAFIGRAALVAVSTLVISGATAAEGWLVSFEKAKAESAKQGKPILMEFTGSDWCPPCIQLAKNVFSKDVFKKEMPKHYILLKLDSPRDKSKQTPEEIAQYKKLSTEYKITGVPSILLTDAEGKPFYRTSGYGGQAAKDWIDGMVAKKNIPEALDAAAGAKGIAKAKLLDKALGLMGSKAAAERKDEIAEIIKLDAENKAGLKAKYEGIQKAAFVEAELQKIARAGRGKTDEVLEKVDALIKEHKLNGPGLQQALFMKSSMLFQTGKKDEAKELLLEAKEAAPDTDVAKRIDGIIKRFFAN